MATLLQPTLVAVCWQTCLTSPVYSKILLEAALPVLMSSSVTLVARAYMAKRLEGTLVLSRAWIFYSISAFHGSILDV